MDISSAHPEMRVRKWRVSATQITHTVHPGLNTPFGEFGGLSMAFDVIILA
jgi:hypothetical protein